MPLPSQDTSYINQNRITRVHTSPDSTRNRVYKNLLFGISSSNLVPPYTFPTFHNTLKVRSSIRSEGYSSDSLEISFCSQRGRNSLEQLEWPETLICVKMRERERRERKEKGGGERGKGEERERKGRGESSPFFWQEILGVIWNYMERCFLQLLFLCILNLWHIKWQYC